MVTLWKPVAEGRRVFLRRLVPSDLDILEIWENDPRVWGASDLGALDACDRPPFSRETLGRFIENQQFDIRRTGQQRLVVCLCDAYRPIGFVDLFDLDPEDRSAGVGVLIYDPADRGRGYGAEAVELVCDYALQVLGLRRLWCNARNENNFSTKLFLGRGFVLVGVESRDVALFERILSQKVVKK